MRAGLWRCYPSKLSFGITGVNAWRLGKLAANTGMDENLSQLNTGANPCTKLAPSHTRWCWMAYLSTLSLHFLANLTNVYLIRDNHALNFR